MLQLIQLGLARPPLLKTLLLNHLTLFSLLKYLTKDVQRSNSFAGYENVVS